MINKIKRHIGFLMLTLLLLIGGATNAWADVTYIILTKPFNVRNVTNTGNYRENIRLEALRCTSAETTVFLPLTFRSPLAKNFKYWKTPTVSRNTRLYESNGTSYDVLPTRYDIYSAVADEMTENSTLEENGNPTVIYVTYDYDEDNTILKLDGAHKYNITMNTGDKMRYLCYNKNRANRPGAALASTVSAQDLISDDFVTNVKGTDGKTTIQAHFQFYLCGEDPYNITIMTAYEGSETFIEKLNNEGTAYKKPHKGATIFAKLEGNGNNGGTTSKMWLSPDAHRHYNSPTDANSYDAWEGFFRNQMNPIFNAVAILPKGTNGYFFVASKLNQNGNIYQPNGSGYYATLTDNGENPMMLFKPIDEIIPMEPDPVTEYTFVVRTAFGNKVSAKAEWSDARIDDEIAAIPDELKRKYCSYSFYKDSNLTQAITTYAQSVHDTIYVKYQVTGMPFVAIDTAATSYTRATWYELTDAGSTQASGKKIKYDGSTNFKNNGGNAVYEKASEFAFVGDPYELRIILRSATEAATAKRYVGAAGADPASGTAFTVGTTETAGYKWEIPDDDTEGSFVLRQFGTNASPLYWQWTTGSSGNNILINSTSTRVKTMELPKYTYTYKVVDLAGNIAIAAAVEQPIFTKFYGYASIPAAIRSPFLAEETVRFYGSYTDRNGDTKINRLDWHNPSEQDSIIETPTAASDIFVSYTTEHLAEKTINLQHTPQEFNVKLNGEYLYWDGVTNTVKSKSLAVDAEELEEDAYLWHLRNRDPYAMQIDNKGYSEQIFGNPISTTSIYFYNPAGDGTGSSESVADGMFIHVEDDAWENDKALAFVNSRSNASRFVAMLGGYAGVYEVMAATGTTDYYHIGRPSTASAEPKIYSTSTYAHGTESLRFELTGSTSITYTLIDKAKNELFTITSKNPRMALPAEFQSPLVETYYYYPTKAKALTDNHTDDIDEIKDDTNEEGDAADNHVWVTYTVNDNVIFNTNSSTKNNPCLLRFHNGKSYRLEDGADKLTSYTDESSKIKAMYPYCNGDGNLNIYGEAMRDEQMHGGTSTRSRWQWFFESANSDPYHVKIHSNNQITTSIGKDYTYLCTYAVRFVQDSKDTLRVVTGSTLPGVWKAATEYMILGTAGNYKLVTTDSIDDGVSKARRTVTSFEQYWKTYNMVKKYVLKISTDAYSEDPTTFVIPESLRSVLKDSLTVKQHITDENDLNYVNGWSWHSYPIVASAVRWNGFDASGKANTKIVEELEHWFQTFDMGDGTFTIENGDIPPVLVLIDRHGWEIMRKPIPMGSGDAEAETKLNALKQFDSPMVKEYKFYSQATKASACHKYSLRLDDKKNERDQIKQGGVHFTSNSLGALPNYVAGRDLFVTYTVKEEYEESYKPATTTASKFIILQNHKFASDESSTLTANVAPANISNEIIADAEEEEASKTFKQESLWYIKPNKNIDDEMGYPWDPIEDYTEKENGFDPYNIQLKNASTSKFFTIDMKKSVLSEGVYTGDYTGGSTNVTLADSATTFVSSPESYDHSTLKMTNQTFMVVQDVNGNMQLMPRFDHSHRINAFTTLAEPSSHAKAAIDDDTPGEQTTFMIRPQVFDYRVIDNQGKVALRYQTGGEFYPSMPEHFKSPLAQDFRFYKTLEDSTLAGYYKLRTLADEITSSFAAAGITTENTNIYIRYEYNETFDTDNQDILQGQWITMSLGGKDVQATGTLAVSAGTGVSLYTGTKDASQPEWQWKFMQSPMVSTSQYYVAPDPYRVILTNREANNDNPMAYPNKMGTAIKIADVDSCFVILSHPSGDYALCVAGDELEYSFLNGGSMTAPDAGTPKAASVEYEADFTKTSNTISDGARIIFTEDVTHTYTYYIINNNSKLAASDTQDNETAVNDNFKPVVPFNIQSPLINTDDYLYYGTANIEGDTYTIDAAVEPFRIDNLFGLFEDVVYVRYPEFSRDKTPYVVPNERNTTSPVAVGAGSNDVAIDINGNLPYNIIWLSDNMMRSSDGSTILDGGANSHSLSGETADKWHFTGNDPYAIKIKHDSGDKYVDGDATLADAENAKSFMLLKRDGYDYGVLALTGDTATKLSGYGQLTITGFPTKFIPFALSVHHVIYHLVINTSRVNTDIPYRTGDEDTYQTAGTWTSDKVLSVMGTTQRNLTSGTPAGATYQLGSTIYFKQDESTTTSMNYCYDAGKMGLGDALEVPTILKRPNCRYDYYVQDVYDNFNSAYDASTGEATGGTDKRCEVLDATLNNRYKGLKIDSLMSKADLIGKTIVINVTYRFDDDLATNAGDGFVTSVDQNLWYTFETNEATPYLAHYTNAWGLQAMEGRATRYTNDYLWLPLGDAYGFRMYNRYIKKNSLTSGDDDTRMMTTDNATFDSEDVSGHENLKMAEPGSGGVPSGNEVYELLASNTAGCFRVHPVINNSGTQYFIRKDPTDNYAKLSTTATEWRFGLEPDLIQPYIDRIDYVGGLESEVANSTDFGENHINVKELITAVKNGSSTPAQRMLLQSVVYDVDNIVEFEAGYYRLHNQPSVSGISPVRYASGYLHEIEKTQEVGYFQKTDPTSVTAQANLLTQIGDYYFRIGTSGSYTYEKVTVTKAYDSEGPTNAIYTTTSSDAAAWTAAGGMPMHFYSRANTSTTYQGEGGLASGFTISDATRGEIPIPATEYDPSSIFYLNGGVTANKTISTATMSTQGLNVAQNRMTTSAGQTFTLMDIGGAVFLIHDGSAPATRMYFNFDQSNAASKYDLQYYHDVPTDDAKWCIEPANNQGLRIETHSGGDGYYYSTFCAPYDVTLPNDVGVNTYDAYVCTSWDTDVIHPTSIGKTITAGTPAIIRTTETSGNVKVTLPGTASSAESCVFTGKYLEQILATPITAENKVYTFGLPRTGYNITITPADGFVNGEINNVVEGSEPAYTGVGFYLNATLNKEKDASTGEWTPNNRYVLHNKIYYWSGSNGASAPKHKDIDYVPVVFDYEIEEQPHEEEPDEDKQSRVGDGCVYDILGRKVATEAEVKNGTWYQRLQPGVYVVDGQKIFVGCL